MRYLHLKFRQGSNNINVGLIFLINSQTNILLYQMKKCKITGIVFFVVLFQLPLIAQVSFGESTKINEEWLFKNNEAKDEFSSKAELENWRKVDLPHDWSVEGIHSPDLASCTGYLPGGIGWYKKTISIPVSDLGKQIYIYFGGVYCNSEVWINNHLLGKRPNGYVSFLYDMTSHINYGGENTILVKVDHSKSADSRWYTGSGIYRDVYLVKANPVHIDLWGVACSAEKITSKSAVLTVNTIIKNSTKKEVLNTIIQDVTLKGNNKTITSTKKNIKIAAGTSQLVTQKMDIVNPKIWSLNNPNLYEVHTTVIQNNKKIDQNTLQTGIRNVVFDADKGLFLNGESMKLKGVCIHHDAGALGSAVPKQVWERRLKELKNLGCNAIRTSHNPQDDAVYDICDEIGLLVMDEAFDEWEFPKRKWLDGWNVGVPGYQGYAEYFNEWGERDIADMVRKHKNHPSIIMWSIGNEVDYPNDPYSHQILDKEGIDQKAVIGYKPTQPDASRLSVIAKKLVDCVRKVDNSRPVTGALAGVIMSNHTDYPFLLDVTGYNYTESRYKMDHEKYPKRVLYGSETRHELKYWESVKNNDFVAGQFLWTGIDYLGEAGAWPSRGFGTGLLDLAGNIKPLGYYRQSLWSEKPMVYIATIPEKENDFLYGLQNKWNYLTGEMLKVACFTNCETVVLKLNDKVIESRPQIDKNTGAQYWTIPFETGKLSATAYNNGKELASYKIVTSERPQKLLSKSDIQSFKGKGDVAQIEIQVVDKSGIPVYVSDNMITFKINGPAKLLGIENGDMSDMVSHKTNYLRVFKGKLIAYIECTEDKGSVEVNFESNWLSSTKIKIDISK